jgi:predicted amidohydrolase
MKKSHAGLAAAGWMVLLLLPWVVAQTSCSRAALTGKESGATMSATAGQDSPPRKVVVGSLMYAMYRDYPGLEKRLQTLSAFIDDMAREAERKYGAGLDLAALPEFAVNGGREGPASEIAEPLEGPVLEIMGAAARKHKTYVIVPLYLAEDAARKKVYNAAVLLDRQGRVAGIYRKVYVVADDNNVLEGGALPGKNFPVFQCDFGKIGIQICFDITYDAGWETLARKGAEIVVWSTQSPQIIGAQCRSHRCHYYLLTSTWRNNATLVDPTGAVIAQTTTPSSVLVEQIDLSYALVDWQVKLQNGKAFTDKYGSAVGFRYSEAEDGGIFWSNDPKIPVMKMVRELGLELSADCASRNQRLLDKARGGPPSLE